MISINLLQINLERTKINVSLETSVGALITGVKLWDSTTFKDYETALDFSSKLAGTSNTEIFSISNVDVGVSKLDGIYFLEITSDDTTVVNNCTDCEGQLVLGIVASFYKYQECLLNKILGSDVNCNGVFSNGNPCLEGETSNILNIKVLLDSTKYALQSGYYTEAIKFISVLDKFCITGCCGYDDYSTPVANTGLNYCTINNELILQ